MVKIGALGASFIVVCSAFANASLDGNEGQEGAKTIALNGEFLDASIENTPANKAKPIKGKAKKQKKPKAKRQLTALKEGKGAEKTPIGEAEIVRDTTTLDSSQTGNVSQTAAVVQNGASLLTFSQSSFKKPIAAKKIAKKLSRRIRKARATPEVVKEEPEKSAKVRRIRKVRSALSSVRMISGRTRLKKPKETKQDKTIHAPIGEQAEAIDPKLSVPIKEKIVVEVDEQDKPNAETSANGSRKPPSFQKSAKLVINASKLTPKKAAVAAKEEEPVPVPEPKTAEISQNTAPVTVASPLPGLIEKAENAMTNDAPKTAPTDTHAPNQDLSTKSLAITLEGTAETSPTSREQREKLFESIKEGQLQKELHLTPQKLAHARSGLTPPASPRSQTLSPKLAEISDDSFALQSNSPTSSVEYSSSPVPASNPPSPTFSPQPVSQASIVPKPQAPVVPKPQAQLVSPQQPERVPADDKLWNDIRNNMASEDPPAVFKWLRTNYLAAQRK